MAYLALAGMADTANLYMAWGYVAVRIIHSLAQVTSNKVVLRFPLFVLGTLLILVMALRAAASYL